MIHDYFPIMCLFFRWWLVAWTSALWTLWSTLNTDTHILNVCFVLTTNASLPMGKIECIIPLAKKAAYRTFRSFLQHFSIAGSAWFLRHQFGHSAKVKHLARFWKYEHNLFWDGCGLSGGLYFMKYIFTSSARTSRGRKFPKGKELYSTERICL